MPASGYFEFSDKNVFRRLDPGSTTVGYLLRAVVRTARPPHVVSQPCGRYLSSLERQKGSKSRDEVSSSRLGVHNQLRTLETLETLGHASSRLTGTVPCVHTVVLHIAAEHAAVWGQTRDAVERANHKEY